MSTITNLMIQTTTSVGIAQNPLLNGVFLAAEHLFKLLLTIKKQKMVQKFRKKPVVIETIPKKKKCKL